MSRNLENLSAREREVLRLLARGHEAKSIAAALNLSVHTVNERLRDARRKLGTSSSREAARLLLAAEGDSDRPQKLGDEPIGVAGHAPVSAAVAAGTADHRQLLVLGTAGGIAMIALIGTVAMMAGASGDAGAQAAPQRRTEYRLRLSAEGRVTSCDIIRSSGDPALDAAACRIVTSKTRFAPASGPDPQGLERTGGIDWTSPGSTG